MDYQNSLNELREQLFTAPAEGGAKGKTGFIPVRAFPQASRAEASIQRSHEWLKEIRIASEELKKQNMKLPKVPYIPEIMKPLPPLEPTEAEQEETFIKRRGDLPSAYAPDIPLEKNSGTINLKSKEEFIAAIYPTAIEVGKETGVDPRIILAQAALETGWGKSAPNNNFFGIKSHGKEGGATLSTKEVVGGKTVTENASFRRYDTPQDSVRGYGEFLMENPRYTKMREAGDLEGQIRALARSGYATDPEYAKKVYSIATGLPPLSEEGQISFIAPRTRS